ncbi:hypothetical protein BV210_09865 [Halorientalis sp. IM1011]|uniref:hypothetical protein n=1 Tax=Halorientalis sp. IM1011 TaxID=1932360 RepID=UPI00097CC4BA|nr:hypothetical protein [Halorientalis sp. IM1011]AQL43002.1 hypothetical protein BV210_09865 [Halorientalis sp. IM1011]
MQSRSKLFALVSVVLLVGAALGPAVVAGAPAVAANDSTEDELDGNETDLNETDGNETELDGNESETNETDGNETESVFGQLVSAFVEETQTERNSTNTTNSTNTSDRPLGLLIAAFVTQNNPGNAPDHAGPPAHAGPGGDDNETERGPPEDRGPSADQRGPPADRGPDRNDENETEVDTQSNDGNDGGPSASGGGNGNAGGNGGGGGPPAHAGGR